MTLVETNRLIEIKKMLPDVKEALDSMDDYARMQVGVDAFGPRGCLEKFIAEVELLIEGD